MQYRASFILLSLGHLAATGIDFIGILVLFERFDSLAGWRLAEVAFLYGLVNVAFAITDAASHGFDDFANMVKSGDFDRLLLRPRSTALQLAGQELTLRRVGRLAQGLFILVWASIALDLDWSVPRALLTLGAIIGGASLFYGLLVLQATLAFWTTETLEIMTSVTYGGVETAQFPLSIYRSWFRRFFTYVIPLAGISYYPSLAIMGRPDSLGSTVQLQYLAPLTGVAFLLVALQVWKVGVRHYRSTGS
jgi:ABC-2 type transport system permease protein